MHITIWSHKEWEDLARDVMVDPIPASVSDKALRRLVHEMKYAALIADHEMCGEAVRRPWWRFWG